MTPPETARLYFDFSNKSDFEGIAQLLDESTTYSSQNTGIFLGADSIIAMQREFHGTFEKLHWTMNSVDEVKPGIVLVDYDFEATTKAGEPVKRAGLEYVVVLDGRIQHVEIRNK